MTDGSGYDPIRPRLIPGERLIWSGRPARGLLLTRNDVFRGLSGLAWCGFAVFWTYEAISLGAPEFVTFWGALSLCYGLCYLVGHLPADVWLRSRTYYAVTDQRVVIYRPPPFGRYTAIQLRSLPELEFEGHWGGRGTIRFGRPTRFGLSVVGKGTWAKRYALAPQFTIIDDAHSVFNLVQRLARQA